MVPKTDCVQSNKPIIVYTKSQMCSDVWWGSRLLILFLDMRNITGSYSLSYTFLMRHLMSTPLTHLNISFSIPILVPFTPFESLASPQTNSSRETRSEKPALKPFLRETRLQRRAQSVTNSALHLDWKIAPQQQRRANHIRGRNLANQQRKVCLRVMQDPRSCAREQVEGL